MKGDQIDPLPQEKLPSKSPASLGLIIRGSGSRKKNSLFNLINHQPYIDQIYLYAKDPYEAKYQLLIKKIKSTRLKHFNDSKAFIEYSIDMDGIYENVEEYNPGKKH